jgi:hypothetical protein
LLGRPAEDDDARAFVGERKAAIVVGGGRFSFLNVTAPATVPLTYSATTCASTKTAVRSPCEM